MLRSPLALLLTGAFLASPTSAADFGHPGGPVPAGVEEVTATLREDPYDIELLLSFGTSSFGSAGHLALGVRDGAGGDDLVYSANFWADGKPEHAEGHYTRDLMCMIPKKEYLFGTTSSLGPDAWFGLDYGEVYKRSVLGIRIRGVPRPLVEALEGFWKQINADYRAGASDTAYQDGPVLYDYMKFNCAKTIALGFKHAGKFRDVRIKDEGFLAAVNPVDALEANVPMETALDIMEAASRRGWEMDAVLYKKYTGSTYRFPDSDTAFEDLPDRFPSVLSVDYTQAQGHYEDYDNLRAMNLLFQLGRASVVVDGEAQAVRIEKTREPLPYDEADRAASAAARKESKGLLRRLLFRSWGLRLTPRVDNGHLYHFGVSPQEP